MESDHAPREVVELARARARARATREWPEADRLRAEIEDAGWRVVDRGTDFSLHVAHPPDTFTQGVLRYGWSGSVPARLDEPAVGRATFVVVSEGDARGLERTITALRSLAGTSLVVVANDPTADEDALLTGIADAGADAGAAGTGADPNMGQSAEVIRTSARLTMGAARNAGLRRASGPIAVVVEAGAAPSEERLAQLVGALDDPAVAVAGERGVASRDLRRFTDADRGDVAALSGGVTAFRRADYVARGPLDERFATGPALDLWWSLVLRDSGDDPPRRAVAFGAPASVPPAGTGSRRAADVRRTGDGRNAAEVDRAARRDRYRVSDRFGGRRDLAVEAGERPAAPAAPRRDGSTVPSG